MKKQFLNCIGVAMFALTSPAMAQNITSATNGPTAQLSFEDISSGFVQNTTTCNSLNVDAVEVDIYAGGPLCVFGVANSDLLSVYGYTGISNISLTPSSDFSGFTVMDHNNSQEALPLPYWQSTQAGNTVNYVDVAIGVTEDYYYSGGALEYFTLVVYESQGEIWLEYYQIDISAGLSIYPPLATGTYTTDNPIQISSANGTAKRPHIELFHNKVTPTNNLIYSAESFAVVWQQDNTNGDPEIWGTDGDISPSSHTTIPEQPRTAFKIDDGRVPDVVAVTSTDPSDNSMAYVCYLSPDEDEVHLSEWELGVSTSGSYVDQLGNTTTNPQEFHYPRISGPMYYDFAGGYKSNDPLAVVVVGENSGGGNSGVNTYNYYSNGNINSIVNASYDGGNGFNKTNYYSIMPVVTGAGELATNLNGNGTPYVEYPTTFYTNYTANGTSPYTSSGDYITMGTDKAYGSTSPILDGGTDYWEVHDGQVMTTTPFDLSGTKPAFAITTANNSGESLITAYFRGDDRIYINQTATNYSFKPTNINSIANAEIAVYPNPVTTAVTIGDGNGSDYTVTDITGKVMASGVIEGNKYTISTERYAAGTYILQLVKDGVPSTVKFVKQ